MDPPREGDETETDVLVAALALIDDVYESSRDRRRLRRRRFSQRHQEIVELHTQVDRLEPVLEALRQRQGSSRGGSATDMRRVWSQVAFRQRVQREDAERLHAILRVAVEHERELARQGTAIVQSLTGPNGVSFPGVVDHVARSLSMKAWVPPALAQRLNEVRTTAWTESLAVDRVQDIYHQADTTQWSPSRDTVQFTFRVTALYPFKLSATTNTLWRLLLLDDSRDSMEERLARDEALCGYSLRLQKPFGGLVTQGDAAMQRTFLPDGSVLLACVAISTGTATPNNLMAGLAMHETLQIRITRRDETNPRSPVVVQIVSQILVKRADGDTIQSDSEDVALRLCRVESFAQRCSFEDRGCTQQALENCLLRPQYRSVPQPSEPLPLSVPI